MHVHTHIDTCTYRCTDTCPHTYTHTCVGLYGNDHTSQPPRYPTRRSSALDRLELMSPEQLEDCISHFSPKQTYKAMDNSGMGAGISDNTFSCQYQERYTTRNTSGRRIHQRASHHIIRSINDIDVALSRGGDACMHAMYGTHRFRRCCTGLFGTRRLK